MKCTTTIVPGTESEICSVRIEDDPITTNLTLWEYKVRGPRGTQVSNGFIQRLARDVHNAVLNADYGHLEGVEVRLDGDVRCTGDHHNLIDPPIYHGGTRLGHILVTGWQYAGEDEEVQSS